MNRLPNLRSLASTTLPLALIIGVGVTVSIGSAKAEQAKKIQILDPMDTDPMKRASSADIVSGRTQHRRVITMTKQGSKNIDISYNIYRDGAGSSEPYAYNKDEMCYFPSGEAWWRSDGKEVITRPGYFMWRPARAATQRARALTDAVTICAFGPARDTEWGHQLSQEEIAERDKDPGKPHVTFRPYQDIEPVDLSAAHGYDKGSIVARGIFNKPRDGTRYLELSHISYKAGVQGGPYKYADDLVCWLESGEIEFTAGGTTETMHAGELIYRPAGAKTNKTMVTKDSVAICYLAPAPEKPATLVLP